MLKDSSLFDAFKLIVRLPALQCNPVLPLIIHKPHPLKAPPSKLLACAYMLPIMGLHPPLPSHLNLEKIVQFSLVCKFGNPTNEPASYLSHSMRLPTGELEFDGQGSHVADPGLDLKVLALQYVHGPPSGPVEPALQIQAVETELDNGESEFVGHAKHVEILLAPTTAEYEPIPQSVHV